MSAQVVDLRVLNPKNQSEKRFEKRVMIIGSGVSALVLGFEGLFLTRGSFMLGVIYGFFGFLILVPILMFLIYDRKVV